MSTIPITRGDAKSVGFTVHLGDDPDNPTPVILTGAKIWFTARFSYTDPDPPVIQLTSDPDEGIRITAPLLGEGFIDFQPEHTEVLPNEDTDLLYDLQVRDAASNPFTVARGRLLVSAEVTVGVP